MNKDHIINSFETILEMLKDRGEDVGIFTKQHVADILAVDSLKTSIEVIINKIKIVYYTPAKFKSADIKKHLEDDEPYELYILVVQENITQNNMKAINQLNLNMEVHLLSRLQFNITKHHLVPKHEVIRDESTIAAILEQYKLKNKYQLPIILRSDPIAKYYGMRNGDIVKVTRVSETAGEYVLYRCCL